MEKLRYEDRPELLKIMELIVSTSEEDSILGATILSKFYPEKTYLERYVRINSLLWEEIITYMNKDSFGMIIEEGKLIHDSYLWNQRLIKFQEIFKNREYESTTGAH